MSNDGDCPVEGLFRQLSLEHATLDFSPDRNRARPRSGARQSPARDLALLISSGVPARLVQNAVRGRTVILMIEGIH